MLLGIVPQDVEGLPERERAMLAKLISQYDAHAFKNAEKEKYYEGKISLNEVNLGIALPENIKKLEIGCAWGAKTVDVLAARSMFEGYVGASGEDSEELAAIVEENNLIAEYQKSARDELKYGCTFATLSATESGRARIRFHSPQAAAAKWSGEKNRIDYGMAVIDTAPDNNNLIWSPNIINMYTDEAIWVIRKRAEQAWDAVAYPHQMGRPMMEPMIWNATTNKPFGRSRIKEPVRRLIQGYVRTIANATIGLEFSTTPQKYLLGVTDKQYDALINQKFKQYVGSIITSTANPQTGENPVFGQLAQGSITPHVEMIRVLATQFSAATGLSVTDTGVVNDANPTSSDAILAQTQTLVGMAEQLNTGNAQALKNIAIMAMAINNRTTPEGLTEEQRDIIPYFKNPAMPSVAVTADAAIKIASSRQSFAMTDTFLEMIGFSQADIRRIKAQEQRQRGLALFNSIEAGAEA